MLPLACRSGHLVVDDDYCRIFSGRQEARNEHAVTIDLVLVRLPGIGRRKSIVWFGISLQNGVPGTVKQPPGDDVIGIKLSQRAPAQGQWNNLTGSHRPGLTGNVL